MNRINNADGGVARSDRLTNGFVKKEGESLVPNGGGVQPKIKRRVKPLASWVATCALLFSPCVPVHGVLRKGDVDFSNYDVPLFEQIVNRIKAKVAARLGEGENRQDRYFIIPFAYQNRWNNPDFFALVHLGYPRASRRQAAQPQIRIQTREIQEPEF